MLFIRLALFLQHQIVPSLFLSLFLFSLAHTHTHIKLNGLFSCVLPSMRTPLAIQFQSFGRVYASEYVHDCVYVCICQCRILCTNALYILFYIQFARPVITHTEQCKRTSTHCRLLQRPQREQKPVNERVNETRRNSAYTQFMFIQCTHTHTYAAPKIIILGEHISNHTRLHFYFVVCRVARLPSSVSLSFSNSKRKYSARSGCVFLLCLESFSVLFREKNISFLRNLCRSI